MAGPRRFPIRCSSVNAVLFRVLLIPPSSAFVDLDDLTIHVRLSWAFSARIPRRMAAGPGWASRRRSASRQEPTAGVAAGSSTAPLTAS